MPTPADPHYKQRQWQGYHESRQEYIQHLLDNINDCKRFIKTYDEMVGKHVDLTDEFVALIKTEKQMLSEYQEELRKVVQS